MVADVLAANYWTNNSEMIADVATLGYISDNCLDATYGLGNFWNNHRPQDLVSNDLYAPAEYSYDFRSFPPEWESSFGTVVYDPPYKLQGAPHGEVDERYGINNKDSVSSRLAAIDDGLIECIRVTELSGMILVKVMNQVASGRVYWQADRATTVAENHGCKKVDEFIFLTRPRPQPSGRRQVHARRNYSNLLIFKKTVLSK